MKYLNENLIKRRDNDIIYRDDLISIKDAQIAKYRRALKNPLYAAYLGSKAIGRKIYWGF